MGEGKALIGTGQRRMTVQRRTDGNDTVWQPVKP